VSLLLARSPSPTSSCLSVRHAPLCSSNYRKEEREKGLVIVCALVIERWAWMIRLVAATSLASSRR